jgi:molybdate transport system substrate-binding protein
VTLARMHANRQRRGKRSAALPLAALAIASTATSSCAGASKSTPAGTPGPSSAGGQRLVVMAAASTKGALASCAPRFARQAGVRVELAFAGSDELAVQIRQGARIDVYAAANTTLPRALHSERHLGRPVPFATNELVVATRPESPIRALADLARRDVKMVLGTPSVPHGAYARAVLARLPAATRRAILANVRSNEPDVKSTVGKLLAGAADAGFIYITDVRATRGKLAALRLPRSLEPQVVYAAGVAARPHAPRLARSFLRDLRAGGCQRALRRAGFGPPPTRG